MTSKLKLLVGISALTCSIIGANSAAYAAGTTQGTDILNTVTVDFQVGGLNQTQQTASDLFEVDRVVRFTLVESATILNGTTSVSPAQQDAVTAFTLTNTSNDVLDFSLIASQIATGGATPTGTDAFDVQNLQFFVDNGDGVFNAATDTLTSVNDLAADGNVTIFVIGDIAASQTNGQVAGVTLTATALNSDGSAIVAATDATANTAGVETIFGDTDRDGIEAADDDYTVAAAQLSVVKVSRVVSDPVSSTNPKAIPGAVVEYCIAVSNAAGAATATGVNLSDSIAAINANAAVNAVTYVPSSAFVDGTSFVAATNTCTAGTTAGAFDAVNNVVSGSLTDIAGGQTRTLVFQVTID